MLVGKSPISASLQGPMAKAASRSARLVRRNRTVCNGAAAAILARHYTLRPDVLHSAAHFRTGASLSIPNLITLGRILLVPVVVWAIAGGEMRIAFLLFLAAGVSDAVDGYLAKHFGMTTELGAYLDPLADKAMMVSIYVALGIAGAIPRWLVILVVSRDIMIVGAVMLSWLVGSPVKVKPLLISKINTVGQIVFACLVLASIGFDFEIGVLQDVVMYLVAALTLLSVGFYVAEWMRHMSSAEVGS
jgi:cardiolipin synthase (CMP-forming)